MNSHVLLPSLKYFQYLTILVLSLLPPTIHPNDDDDDDDLHFCF